MKKKNLIYSIIFLWLTEFSYSNPLKKQSFDAVGI